MRIVKLQVMDAIIDAHPELEIPQSLIAQGTGVPEARCFNSSAVV